MSLKVILVALTSMGLLAGGLLEGARAQSQPFLREYPAIFQLMQKGKEGCEKGDLALCVDVTRQVSNKIQALRASAGSFGERILLIATRAITAAGFNIARAVAIVDKADKEQTCALLGNALLHIANADEALEGLPVQTWDEEVKRSVRRLQADSASQRRKLRPLVNKVCPSAEAL